MNTLLAIYDQDLTYSERLANFISNNTKGSFDISSYSLIDSLIKDIISGHISHVLIDANSYIKHIAHSSQNELISRSVTYILLTGLEDNLLSFEDIENIPSIWKYQSGEAIKNALLDTLSQCPNTISYRRQKTDTSDTTLYGVYSPSVGFINSSLSVLLSNHLATKGKTLCIFLDPIVGFDEFSIRRGDITDLIYYIQNGNTNIELKLESLIKHLGSVDYILPAFSYMDIKDVDKESWLTLTTLLIKSKLYTNIVFSCSEVVDGLFELLSVCNYFIEGRFHDAYSANCDAAFQSLYKETCYEMLIDKRISIKLSHGFRPSPSMLSYEYDDAYREVRELIKNMVNTEH